MYEPPVEVSSCLNGASLYVSGPSEVMALLGWLSGGEQTTKRASLRSPDVEEWNLNGGGRSLGCVTRRNLAMRFWECKQHNYAARGKCREELYARKPFEANCTGRTRAWRNASFSLHGYWKSFQYTSADLAIHSAVRHELQQSAHVPSSSTTARAGPSSSPPSPSSPPGLVIVQLSAGLQQFARIPGHEEKRLHVVEENATWPQEWIDDWVNETAALFRLFSPQQWRTLQGQTATAAGGRRVCAVWRAQNIAARHTNLSEPRHHPSTVNGVNHWLNRLGIALARIHGLGIVDYTDFTATNAPLSTYADDRPTGASARKADTFLEGDVYHGYKMNTLAPVWLSALAKACCGSSA